MLNDNDPSIVAEVLPDLIQTRDFYFLQHATQTLNELLDHDDPQQRAIGVRILGNTDSPHVLLLLLRYIIDRSQIVRLQSVLAIETLSSSVRVTDELVQALSMTVSALLRDPLDRIRLSAVQIIANLHPKDFAERIMPALLDDNLEVRERAAQLLIAKPHETAKTLTPILDSGHGLMSRMISSVLVRIDRNKYEDRIYENIDDVLRTIYENVSRIHSLQSLKSYPTIDVIESIIEEENQLLLDEIFYLLGSIHGVNDVAIAVDALQSTIPRTRANGVEAIDVMLNLHLLTGIEKFTNPDLSLAELHDYGQSVYSVSSSDAKQVIRELIDQHNEEWKIYIGIEALGELGQHLHQSQTQPQQSPLDLLSALGGNDNDSPSKGADNIPFTLDEIRSLLASLQGELPLAIRTALRRAKNAIQGITFERSEQRIGSIISDVERIIFLKRVQFFQDISISQLRKVATACHEVWYDADQVIFTEDQQGGSLYIIIEGRVGIERTQGDGKSARLNTLKSEDSFGEDTLFDESPHSTSAISLSRTLLLRLDSPDCIRAIKSELQPLACHVHCFCALIFMIYIG
ncbi:MAG: cyclic nucleotide-binding domain-containing protein, partial [Chloroflexota bacterium]